MNMKLKALVLTAVLVLASVSVVSVEMSDSWWSDEENSDIAITIGYFVELKSNEDSVAYWNGTEIDLSGYTQMISSHNFKVKFSGQIEVNDQDKSDSEFKFDKDKEYLIESSGRVSFEVMP